MSLKAGENKVQFGLDELHYAIITENAETGAITFGTPVKVPGARSIEMDPEGEQTIFYADNIRYWISQDNNGYSGTLEIAKVPEQMREDIWGDTLDTNGVLTENADVEPKEVALLGRFSGDKNKNLFALYRVTLARPSASHATTEGSKEPQTASISYTAIPLPNGRVKATTTSTTTEAVKNAWFESVYQAT